MVHKHFKKGETIWFQGDEATELAIIISGVVKLTKSTEDGRQQILGLLLASDFLGIPFRDYRQTSSEAVSDTKICCFPRIAFEKILKEHSSLEHALLEKSYKDLTDAREWLVALGRLNATERLASFLLRFAMRSIPPSRCETLASENLLFHIPITRADIADYLGMTIETVSRKFTKLGRDRVIELVDDRTVRVLDLEALRRLSNS